MYFLCFSVSVSALAACDNEAAYELIYSVSPLLAQKLKPVHVSCEDNGIKMEVVACGIRGERHTDRFLVITLGVTG